MNFEMDDKPGPQNARDHDSNKSPQDNIQNHSLNNNYNENQEYFPNNDLDLELNRNHYQYPEGLKDENFVNESQRIEEQKKITNIIFKSFLVKVYGILSVQLIITLIFIFLFQSDSIKSYFTKHPIFSGFLNLLSFIGFIALLLILSVNQDLGKRFPNNYIFLLLITICMSLTCAFFALSYSYSIVLFCVILTIISAIAITIYAYSTNKDFSYVRGLFAVILSQFGGFIFMIFMLDISFLEMVCCLVGTLLFGVYLVYDTQVIFKKYGEVYSIDDYIFASLQIYIDIANLFMIILATVGRASKNN